MPLRIRERLGPAPTEWIEEWPFAAKTKFIRSQPYAVLWREISRYVRNEVSGCSFLVAGHRGAGKTTLVRRVVDDVNRAILEDAVKECVGGRGGDRAVARQRPLLVRLHGPSMFGAAEPPLDAVSERPASAAARDMATVAALTQIAVALFRALAAEHGRAFAGHARDRAGQVGPSGRQGKLEQAGQLVLDLDSMPRPAVLRDFYARLDRLEYGVLWPRVVGAAQCAGGLSDQGVREIVAITTAAQAFETCVGTSEQRVEDKHAEAYAAKSTSRFDADFKDLFNKLIAVLLGLGTYLAQKSVIEAAAVGLVTTATFGFTSERSRNLDRQSTYSFVRDRSRQSLERDLPWVIQRVRDAGLAPIFIVDELDKVPDADVAIGDMIGRLKHLVTDYGAFCFLTDRDYFDYVTQRTDRESYPPEHTLYSHRLFVIPSARELEDFLLDLIEPDALPDALLAASAARQILALFVLHQSKMNTADALRELGRLCDDVGRVIVPDAVLNTDTRYNLAAAVQLAINQLFRHGDLAQRAKADAGFLQVASDALYLISRAWEAEKTEVSITEADVSAFLSSRRGTSERPDGESAADTPRGSGDPGPVEMRILARSVERLADMLCDFDAFTASMETDAAVSLPEVSGLLEKLGPSRYRFRFDVFGVELRAEHGADGRRDPEMLIVSCLRFLEAVELLGVKSVDLVVAGVLPPVADPEAVRRAISALSVSAGGTQDFVSDEASKALMLLLSFAATVERRSSLITYFLAIARAVHAATDADGSRIAAAVARHIDLASPKAEQGDKLMGVVGLPIDLENLPALSMDVDAIRAWSARMSRGGGGANLESAAACWLAWRGKVRRFLTEPDDRVEASEPARLADVAAASLGQMPGAAFRRDLDALTRLDWTRICLSAFPSSESDEESDWAFPVALSMLGVERRIVAAAVSLVRFEDSETRILIDATAGFVGERSGRGILAIVEEGSRSGAARMGGRVPSERRIDVPILAIEASDMILYGEALQWLEGFDAFGRIFYEDEDGGFPQEEAAGIP